MHNPLTPNLSDIFTYIDDHSQTFLSRLIDYLRHPSISAYGEGISVPYANPDESNHAPNENMEIARFFMGIKTGAAMLSYLGISEKSNS